MMGNLVGVKYKYFRNKPTSRLYCQLRMRYS